MADGTKFDIDTRPLVAMCDDLARLSGRSFGHVIVDQVAQVLKLALKYTPAATGVKIRKRVKYENENIVFPTGEILSWFSKAGAWAFLDASNFRPRAGAKPPQRIVNGKSWHIMDAHHRWNPGRLARFGRFMAEAKSRRRNISAAVRARGLAKRTWVQIAEDLGVDLAPPGFVAAAKPSNGKFYKNGTAVKLLGAASYFIEISNDNPGVVKRLNGRSILERALAARAKAFQIETERGVFRDVETCAKRYPGIFVN